MQSTYVRHNINSKLMIKIYKKNKKTAKFMLTEVLLKLMEDFFMTCIFPNVSA